MVPSEHSGIPDDVVRRRVSLPGKGIEIALQDWGGDGPLALFHHANGFCAALFAPVAEPLRERFHVVAMDARGHGDSSMPPEGAVPDAFSWSLMAEDLQDVAAILLEETGEQRIGLGLGHSFGGTMIMTAESRQPGLYERLVLVDPVIPPATLMNADMELRETEMVVRARRRRHRWSGRAAAREYFSSKELFAHWTPRAMDLYVEEALRDTADGGVELKCAREVEAEVFASSFSLNLKEVFPAIQAPALILWARQGNFPLDTFQQMCDQVPDATLVEMDAGHLMPMEKPESVVEQVLGFCA